MSKRTRRESARGSGCAPLSPGRPQRSLAAIVRAYIRLCRPRAIEELDTFRNEPTLSAAVKRAALARRPNGKRYDHQRRLSPDALQEVLRRLAGVELGNIRDFERLHDLFGDLLGPIPGVGELMIYDTSLRVGARLGLKPRRVYLHRGTREGARALGLDSRAPHLEVEALPRELRVLEPHEIEDCLCIFKEELRS